MDDFLLAATGLQKRFPGVHALQDASFHLRKGEVHALMGENGAGKSTLLKVLTGVFPADSGEILLLGQAIRPQSTLHASRLGISAVYQEVNLAPNLSVAENVCLGDEPRGPLGIRWKPMRERATAALARLGLELDVRAPLGSYGLAIQQMTAIARALDRQCSVLVLDEPTSSLDRPETAQLFAAVRRLREQGIGVIFVTHFLDQVYEISDRITVLRSGKVVGTGTCAELPRQELVRLMLGSEGTALSKPEPRAEPGEELVACHSLGSSSVDGVTLSVCGGQVLGLAGLLGSGRTETLRLLYGVDSASRGDLKIQGKPAGRWSVRKAIGSGLGLCPEDRKTQGIVPGLSIRENAILVLQAKRGWLRPIPRRRQNAMVDEMIRTLSIATDSMEKPIEQLSGGNQQKGIIARWLLAQPSLLLLDEPTRGLDIGAKGDVMSLVGIHARQGMGFVFVSSELPEVLGVSTHLAVFRDRRQAGSLARADATEEGLMAMIAEGEA